MYVAQKPFAPKPPVEGERHRRYLDSSARTKSLQEMVVSVFAWERRVAWQDCELVAYSVSRRLIYVMMEERVVVCDSVELSEFRSIPVSFGQKTVSSADVEVEHICYMLYATCYILYTIYYMLYATRYMLPGICYMLYAICYSGVYTICYILYAIYYT